MESATNYDWPWIHHTGGYSGVFLVFLMAALRLSKAGHHSTQKGSEISRNYHGNQRLV
jgi:hypothetical protein